LPQKFEAFETIAHRMELLTKVILHRRENTAYCHCHWLFEKIETFLLVISSIHTGKNAEHIVPHNVSGYFKKIEKF